MNAATTIRAPAPVNDQEPSDEAMDRLWAALDATLDPSDANTLPPPAAPPAAEWCRRCGYGRLFGQWHPRSAHPRGCPHCHSAYWDTLALTERGRKLPTRVSLSKIRRERVASVAKRRRYRHLARVRKLARELGLDITDPRTGRTGATTAAWTPPAKEAAMLDARATTQPATQPATVAQFRRTVPPPPGATDDGRGGSR
jgi:pyruvate/2-oxoglutarate dehydrogenase complex dihydrolipoamide acyltransferase (E2) component